MDNAIMKIRHEIIQVSSNPDGAVFWVVVKIPMSIGWIERVKFSVGTTREKKIFQMSHLRNDEEYSYFRVQVDLPTKAIYHYYFSFEANSKFYYYKRINETGDQSITKKECWKLSVNFKVPDWAQGATMYHIFVDRYRRGTKVPPTPMRNRKIHKSWDETPVLGKDEDGLWNVDFYGGDLKGIEETLNYIKKLGVDIIYLSPILRSQSNHRYDTGDYLEIDPYVGTDEILKQLCDAAHRKGMNIIIDAVFNHTGNDSKYFNEFGSYDCLGAFQSENSEYYDFYKKHWEDGKIKFSYWWEMINLPECDGNSKKWREFIFGEGGVIDHWFSLGIDGLRLDVADELNDDFIEGIVIAAKRNKPDAFIIGEVWKNPMRMNRGYIESGKGMHTVMNYLLVDAVIRYIKYSDVQKLKYVLEEIFTEYPEETIYSSMNFTSTHDISRAIEIWGTSNSAFQKFGEWGWNLKDESIEWVKSHELTASQYKFGKNLLKTYMYVLAFLPGTISIFYGDEVGLCGIGNLANRAPYPWGKRDKDLLKFFRTILMIRKHEEFLRKASFRVVKLDSDQFVFERWDNNNKILVAISRTHNPTVFEMPEEYENAEILLKKQECSKTSLAPFGAIVLKSNNNN